ncbi:MAG: carbohydrate ABC transporter permease [Flexilinea sp.]
MKGKKELKRKNRNDTPFIYGMLSPMVIMFICFGLFPILYSLLLSVQNLKLNLNRTVKYIGFENYIKAFSDKTFIESLPKTAYFVALLITGSILIGMIYALIVNSKYIKAKHWFILLGLLPWAIPKVVSGLMFNWVFDGNYGILNFILKRLGLIDNYQWWFTKGPIVSLTLCAVVSVWHLAPFAALLLYAGMQTIPQSHYEAAELDGANIYQSFFYITLPGLQSVLMTLMILVTTWALKTFDTISVMTSGGPGTDTTITYLYIYKQSFSYQNTSYSAALGWMFAILIGLFIVLYVRVFGRDIEG